MDSLSNTRQRLEKDLCIYRKIICHQTSSKTAWLLEPIAKVISLKETSHEKPPLFVLSNNRGLLDLQFTFKLQFIDKKFPSIFILFWGNVTSIKLIF